MTRYIALVPAAGGGTRMGAEVPKQYLPLLGRPLIWHALKALCAVGRIERVVVVLSVADAWWKQYDWSELGPRLQPVFCGGPTRADSVLNGLHALHEALQPGDWVLVHDAARPCLGPWQVDALIDALKGDDVGGILAIPVADTLKQADSQRRVARTVPRDALWQAQTPQMFRYAMLKRALEQARDVTDEASALEGAGLHPRLVPGDATNLKVTWPHDLQLAEWILSSRSRAEQACA